VAESDLYPTVGACNHGTQTPTAVGVGAVTGRSDVARTGEVGDQVPGRLDTMRVRAAGRHVSVRGGHSSTMEDNRDRASTNQPLNAEPRRKGPAILAVIGLIVLIALVFLAITWARYST
jgi:hypothetical protein